MIATENPVNATVAAQLLGQPGKPWGSTRMSAIKRAMGITGRYLFVSEVRQWLHENTDFRERHIYPRNPTSKPQSIHQDPRFVNAGRSGGQP
jgi:hypothetical protein